MLSVHAISPLNAQLIHWISHRKIFLFQFYTRPGSFQILHIDFAEIVFVQLGVSSADFALTLS